MPIMNNPQRAIQVWSLLALAAMKRTILTYEEVTGLTGLHQGLGAVLGHVAQYCKHRSFPCLTALVVYKSTGKPASHLYDTMDVAEEQWECFQFDWLGHRPSLQDVEKPWQNHDNAVA